MPREYQFKWIFLSTILCKNVSFPILLENQVNFEMFSIVTSNRLKWFLTDKFQIWQRSHPNFVPSHSNNGNICESFARYCSEGRYGNMDVSVHGSYRKRKKTVFFVPFARDFYRKTKVKELTMERFRRTIAWHDQQSTVKAQKSHHPFIKVYCTPFIL